MVRVTDFCTYPAKSIISNLIIYQCFSFKQTGSKSSSAILNVARLFSDEDLIPQGGIATEPACRGALLP
jgi:hypothetical protein